VANDFTDYDAYIGSQGLIFHEDPSTKPSTQALPLRPPKQDVPNQTEFEQSPYFGDLFAQGDFSHGAGQLRFHSPGRDPKKYLHSEGFDITSPGRLRHLQATALAYSSATIGKTVEVCNSLPFIIDNTGANRVLVGNSALTVWTPEATGGGAVQCDDLASSGDILYAAQNNVYQRNAAGTWASWVTAGATAIDRVAWLKDRLICTDGRNIYEITVSGALPTAMETLPTGWRFESLFEYGEFIYATTISTVTGRSKVHHYGPNQDYSALEKKGNTEMPRGQLAYSGGSYVGQGYIGGGVKTRNGGMNPIVYQCFQDARGFLTLVKLVEVKELNVNTSNPVSCFEGFGESMFFGWVRASTTYGNRSGLAVHHLARDAFAHHLKASGTDTNNVTSVKVYNGKLLMIRTGVGLHYEDNSNLESFGEMILSVADFHNAGQKIWDTFEVTHSVLASSQSIVLAYSLDPPVEGTALVFTTVLTSNTVGTSGKTTTVTDNSIKTRQLTLRIRSNGTASLSPEMHLITARANPAPGTQEYVLTRAFRILAIDRKDQYSQQIFQDPDAILTALYATANTWVTYQEANKTWASYVTGVQNVIPLLPIQRVSAGESVREGYIVQIEMVAR
jgi:hypothetical protein